MILFHDFLFNRESSGFIISCLDFIYLLNALLICFLENIHVIIHRINLVVFLQ